MFYSDTATTKGGGVKGLATEKKRTFFKVLVAGQLKRTFFAASLTKHKTSSSSY